MSSPKTYSELSKLNTFKERFDYLSLGGVVAKETFGYERYLNQRFYTSKEWQRVRNEIIVRDMGCDLGLDGYEINGRIIIHHMNPIMLYDIVHRNESILDPEYLVCVSHKTHNALHYGDDSNLDFLVIERKPNDTCPWKK